MTNKIRFCYRCKKKFEAEVKNIGGIETTDMFCPACYAIKGFYSKLGKKSAAVREKKILDSIKKVERKNKNKTTCKKI